MLDLYLIRHAESEMNTHSDLIGGRSNGTLLSERGKVQADLLGRRLNVSEVVFDEIYSSTARRTLETAERVISHLGYSHAIVQSPRLLELDQGDWEGKPRVEIYTPEVLAAIRFDNWNFTPPHGESQRDVEERMIDFVHETLLERCHEDLRVSVFTHGMAIKCFLRGIMDFSPKITYNVFLENTSITRLKYSERGWHVLTLNDTAHLLGEK